MTPEERRQYGETLVNAVSPAARPEGDVRTDFRAYPGVVSFRCRIGDFIGNSGGRMQFELPGAAATARSLGAVGAKRCTPFLRSHAVDRSVRYEISLPENCHVIRRRPARERLGKRNRACYQADTVEKRGMLTIDTQLTLPVELVQPLDYNELVDLQRDLNSLSHRRVILACEAGKGK